MDDAESDGGRTLPDARPLPLEGEDLGPSANDLEATIGLAKSARGPDLTTTGADSIGSESIDYGQTIAGLGCPEPPLTARALPTVPGYLIEAEVGRGGMGVVYRARQRG